MMSMTAAMCRDATPNRRKVGKVKSIFHQAFSLLALVMKPNTNEMYM